MSGHQIKSHGAARLAIVHCQMTSLGSVSYLPLLKQSSFGALPPRPKLFYLSELTVRRLFSGVPPPLKRVCHVKLSPPRASSAARRPLPQLCVFSQLRSLQVF